MGQTGVAMGRRKKEINETYEERQERFNKTYEAVQKNIYRQEVTFDTKNYVVMSNSMIKGIASNLTLTEMKFLRFIIMQTKRNDEELYEFSVSTLDLAQILEIGVDALYKSLDEMTDHIMREVICIDDKDNDQWEKFHWVDVCKYKKGIVTIKISDELKPFLLGLRGCFSRYRLEEIIHLKSMYALRIYENLVACMNEKRRPHADKTCNISISIDELRRITDTTDKYVRFSQFKTKVMDIAIAEINQKTMYHVEATTYTHGGKKVRGYDFEIYSQAGWEYAKKRKTKTRKIEIVSEEEPINEQLELDFDKGDNYISID